MWNSALRKKFIVFIFQQFLASVDKFLFSGGGGTERWAIFLWDFKIFLTFPNFLRSLSPLATLEATVTYHVYY